MVLATTFNWILRLTRATDAIFLWLWLLKVVAVGARPPYRFHESWAQSALRKPLRGCINRPDRYRTSIFGLLLDCDCQYQIANLSVLVLSFGDDMTPFSGITTHTQPIEPLLNLGRRLTQNRRWGEPKSFLREHPGHSTGYHSFKTFSLLLYFTCVSYHVKKLLDDTGLTALQASPSHVTLVAFTAGRVYPV
jgi:hypothetical protein